MASATTDLRLPSQLTSAAADSSHELRAGEELVFTGIFKAIKQDEMFTTAVL